MILLAHLFGSTSIVIVIPVGVVCVVYFPPITLILGEVL